MVVDQPTSSRLILAVDDDKDNLRLVSSALKFQGYQVEAVSSGEEALEKLQHITPDLVLLDINMTGISGHETLKRLRMRQRYVSVIFVTAQSEIKDVISGLDLGADDYICKPFDPRELLARVRAQLRIKDLNDQLASANLRLQELVDIDDLTGLHNMRSMYERIDTELQRARRYGRTVAAAMMDMDFFKTVNDSHDHLFGSFVLSEVGTIIRNNIRLVDFAARYGGDEFLIILTETNAEGAKVVGERLRNAISSRHFKNGKDEMHITASLGIAVTRPGAPDCDARGLVRAADRALYEAKNAGRNRIHIVDGIVPTQAKPKAG